MSETWTGKCVFFVHLRFYFYFAACLNFVKHISVVDAFFLALSISDGRLFCFVSLVCSCNVKHKLETSLQKALLGTWGIPTQQKSQTAENENSVPFSRIFLHAAIWLAEISNRIEFVMMKTRVRFCRNYYYNVVRYVHIPLVPKMQERSEAERRAIWPCLNVATWRRERSDRAIQQICKPFQINQVSTYCP